MFILEILLEISVFFLIIKKYRKDINYRVQGVFIYLIFFVGNERGVDILSFDRQIRMEGVEINKSFLAFKVYIFIVK